MPDVHLLVHGSTCMSFSRPYLERCLIDLVNSVDLTVIAGPDVEPIGRDWNAFAMHGKGHVAVYTQGDAVYADFFSIQPFNVGRPMELMRDRLRLTEMTHQVIERIVNP